MCWMVESVAEPQWSYFSKPAAQLAGAGSCWQLGLTETAGCILTCGGSAAPSLARESEEGHCLNDSLGQSGLLLDKWLKMRFTVCEEDKNEHKEYILIKMACRNRIIITFSTLRYGVFSLKKCFTLE